MNINDRKEMIVHILILSILIIAVGGMFFYADTIFPIAHTCPQNDITTLESHIVTFVVVDTQLHPLSDMRVDIACIKKRTHNYTLTDGSCSFVMEGGMKHTVRVDEMFPEREKTNFVLYPINSCYLIVLKNGSEK